MKHWKLIIFCVGAFFGIAVFYGWNELNRNQKNTASSPDVHIPAKGLVTAFRVDETLANKMYNDKIVCVTGTISKITVADGVFHVAIDAGDPTKTVLCIFEPGENKEMKKLTAGQEIQIKGICTGMLTDVVLAKCVIISS